jgi:hypothetical protein
VDANWALLGYSVFWKAEKFAPELRQRSAKFYQGLAATCGFYLIKSSHPVPEHPSILRNSKFFGGPKCGDCGEYCVSEITMAEEKHLWPHSI